MGKKMGKGGTYEVGYCKPPKHTQWSKGVSGNPAGKKSKAESFADMLKKIADEEIIVSKNGAPVAMTNFEAMTRKAFLMAQGGHPQFYRAVSKELLEAGDLHGPPAFEVSEADIEVLETEADFRALIEAAQAQIQAADSLDAGEMGGKDDPADTV